MSDEKKIEFSQSDVLNALLHRRGHEQHYATQESVDNVKDGIKELSVQVSQQFEQVDKRFEQVDKRFEQVNKQFEQVDKRFEQVDKQFEQVDKHFERLETRIDQVDNKIDSLKNVMIGMGFSILVGAVGATAFIVSRLPV
ncbi:hypothetical protein L0B53_00295 [Vibrio sp. SS-MA-C1-2]|uniref:hypothetical protein n=1 Tax=Vibrio sp. SS-MA-C1-2 TaxID=2908646 RepID=UPI001F205A07|nr:hypothetical protein [Vibrio sp. SS-MA-C1-2]UJF17252.1 hypothetical protein L0B53_00295 [Vibrio sp. SS-MA-C1-2]